MPSKEDVSLDLVNRWKFSIYSKFCCRLTEFFLVNVEALYSVVFIEYCGIVFRSINLIEWTLDFYSRLCRLDNLEILKLLGIV